jgi:hypothetical protein
LNRSRSSWRLVIIFIVGITVRAGRRRRRRGGGTSSLAHLDIRVAVAGGAAGAGGRAGAGSLLHARALLRGLEKLDQRRHILRIGLLV